MCRAKTSLQIDDIEYRTGDKVLINTDKGIRTGNEERIETVLRKIKIEEDCIVLWFSKNNFASKFSDKNYDVITHFLWKETLDDCVYNLNIEHISKLKKE